MKKRNLLLLNGWLFLMLVSACGDGGGGSTGDAMYEEVTQVVDGLVDHWNSGSHAELEDAYQSVADYLDGQAIVEWVELDTTGALPTLWAGFENGITYTLMAAENVHEVDPEDLPPPPPGISQTGIPGKKALFLELVGLPSPASTIKGWVDSHEYDAELKGDATGKVEFFQTLHTYDLLYISSHGCYLKRGTDEYYATMTGELRSRDREREFINNGYFDDKKIMLAQKLPFVAVGEYSIPQLRKSATHYAVTDRYVAAQPGDFRPFSLVVLDMCQSAKPHKEPFPGNPLVKVLLAKKAGGVLGWDESVAPIAGIRAFKYLFSRLLSEDEHFEPKSPPVRPFGATAAHEGLQAKGYDVDNIPKQGDPSYQPSMAKLIWAPQRFGSRTDQHDVLLLPSIHKLDTTNLLSDQEIEILGEFGNVEGEVCFGDSCTGAKEWDTNTVKVTCDPDKHGPVTVKVDDRESNEVPLTRWQGVFEVDDDVNPEIGPHLVVKMNFKVRADIHRFRPTAEAEAFPPFSQDAGSFEEGVECDYTIEGRVPAFEDDRYYYDYAGSGKPKVSSDGGEYGGAITLKPADGEAEVQVLCLARGTVTRTDKRTGIAEPPEDLVLPITGYFTMPMDAYGTIQAGEEDLVMGAGGMKVEWKEIKPDSPPDDDTPG